METIENNFNKRNFFDFAFFLIFSWFLGKVGLISLTRHRFTRSTDFQKATQAFQTNPICSTTQFLNSIMSSSLEPILCVVTIYNSNSTTFKNTSSMTLPTRRHKLWESTHYRSGKVGKFPPITTIPSIFLRFRMIEFPNE